MSQTSAIPSRVRAARVLTVGDAMLDRYWFGSADRVSPEAPVPVVRITREDQRLGGAANVALNVRRLGASAGLMTVVGKDDPARDLQQMLREESIDAHLDTDPQLRTIVKLRIVGRGQQLLRVDFENKPDHEVLLGMLGRFEQTVHGYHAVLFSDYGKGGLTHIPQMIQRARAAQVPVLVDPKGNDWDRYAGSDVITPNRAELAQVVGDWSGEADLHQRAQNLRVRLNFRSLVLTRSEEGMSVFDDDGHVHVPAQAREVFDVTGAGDTVIATLAVLLASGLNVREALPWANRAGGLVVGKFGTASVTAEELFSS